MPDADNFVFENALESQGDRSPFLSRQIGYIIDQNGQSYQSNQILLDSSSFSNSGKWVDYRQAYLSIPLVAAIYPTSAVSGFDAKTPNFILGMKAGWWQLIDSFSCELNNTTIIQLTRASNHYISYKMTAALSMSDVLKFGPSIGFWPDTVDAFEYHASASPSGHGISNNKAFGFENLYPSASGVLFTTATVNAGQPPLSIGTSTYGKAFDGLYAPNYPSVANTTQSTANHGLYQRTKLIAFNQAIAPYSTLITANQTQQILKSYFTSISNSQTSDAGVKVYYMTATIFLRHLHDFFDKVPPLKSAYLRFVINTNTNGSLTLTSALQAASNTAPALTTWTMASTTYPNSTCPIMFASSDPGQGSYDVDPVGSKTWVIQTGIGSINTSGAAGNTQQLTHFQRSVRLYAPLYIFNDQYEETYLKAEPIKKITYTDIYQYVIANVSAGSQINNLLSNGVVNPTKLIICPQISGSSNGCGFSPSQTPFATEPATVAPLSFLRDFNILVAGQNIMMLNETYTFSNFLDEASHQWCVNGGLSDGLQSGLVSEYTYGMGHGWVVVDISRRVPIEDAVPKSLQVNAVSASSLTLDLIIFCETQRTISVNLASGELEQA